MKDYNISGHGFTIICKSKKEKNSIHQLVDEYHRQNPSWIEDRDNQMLSIACTYMAVAERLEVRVRFHHK